MSAAFNPLPLHEAQAICEKELGQHVDWNGAEGFIVCPGIDAHSTRNNHTDCKVVAECIPLPDGTLKPGVYCYHESCRGACDAASHNVRSALGKRAPSGGVGQRAAFKMPRPRNPAVFDPSKLQLIADRLPGVDESYFAARSKKTVHNRTPASFLAELYQPGEKVIVFTDQGSQGQHLWERRDPLDAKELDSFRRGAREGVWFLSNPVSGESTWTGKMHPKGHPKAGERHYSRRWQKCITSWRYLLLESDKAEPSQWLSMLAQLTMPISAVYTSGARSIHALVRIDAPTKEDWDEAVAKLKEGFVIIGGDRGAMSAVRLTRLPLCERLGRMTKDGTYEKFPEPQMQRLLYLNGAPDGTPICQQEVLR